MSRYPDDQYDDGREDRFEDRAPDRILERARSIVSPPAIGLIVVAIFSFLSIILGVIQYPGLDKQFDDAIKEVENKPNVPNNVKQDQVDMMNKFRDGMKTGMPIIWVVVGIQSIITLIAGLKLRTLTGRGWVVAGSIMSMIPCLSGCCLLGLVFGIWALVSLGKPEVKAAYAANSPGQHPDDQYMR